jgi:hypothetical protein
VYGFRCQAQVSLGPLSTPIKDKSDRFPVQAVLHPERSVCDFGVLVRIGDDFFVALANLFKRKGGMSHIWLRFDRPQNITAPEDMTEDGVLNNAPPRGRVAFAASMEKDRSFHGGGRRFQI